MMTKCLGVGCAGLIFLGQLLTRPPYTVRERPLTNITTPQVSAQVMSPQIYEQLGAQDRAIADTEKRFALLDQRLTDTNSSIDKLKAELKPVQDTNVQIELILRIIAWVFGILLSSGVIAAVLHFLRDRFSKGGASNNSNTLGDTVSSSRGVLSTVFAEDEKSK